MGLCFRPYFEGWPSAINRTFLYGSMNDVNTEIQYAGILTLTLTLTQSICRNFFRIYLTGRYLQGLFGLLNLEKGAGQPLYAGLPLTRFSTTEDVLNELGARSAETHPEKTICLVNQWIAFKQLIGSGRQRLALGLSDLVTRGFSDPGV